MLTIKYNHRISEYELSQGYSVWWLVSNRILVVSVCEVRRFYVIQIKIRIA
jgi:hypothetical protein